MKILHVGFVLVAVMGFAAPSSAFAQMNTCGAAVQQLQDYAARVNQAAQFEYNQGIPARCGGNPYCMQGMLQQLNMWYAQQSSLVNNHYMQIMQQCSSDRGRSGARPRPPREVQEELDVSDLEVDDEDRTVRIRIPSTPQGFRARR